MTLYELLELGGWAIWPLLVFSVFSITLILERGIYFIIHGLDVKKVRSGVLERIEKGDITGAVTFCEDAKKRQLSPKIFRAGLLARELGEHRMERVMETEASEKINSLERGFDLLVAIGSIAPITGFLGTVSGMIGAFQSIATADDVNAQLVAGGIFEALITTAFGLIIAIVAISFFNIFAHFVDSFAKQIEEAGSEMVTRLLFQQQRSGRQ